MVEAIFICDDVGSLILFQLADLFSAQVLLLFIDVMLQHEEGPVIGVLLPLY